MILGVIKGQERMLTGLIYSPNAGVVTIKARVRRSQYWPQLRQALKVWPFYEISCVIGNDVKPKASAIFRGFYKAQWQVRKVLKTVLPIFHICFAWPQGYFWRNLICSSLRGD